jgi:hypothetical protein
MTKKQVSDANQVSNKYKSDNQSENGDQNDAASMMGGNMGNHNQSATTFLNDMNGSSRFNFGDGYQGAGSSNHRQRSLS